MLDFFENISHLVRSIYSSDDLHVIWVRRAADKILAVTTRSMHPMLNNRLRLHTHYGPEELIFLGNVIEWLDSGAAN